jgi:hypothetical protein
VSTQCTFEFLDSKDVEFRFDGGSMSTDAGLSVFIEWMTDQAVIDPFASILEETDRDRRDPDRVEHSVDELLRQRVLQLVAGYEDANDCDQLREEPLFCAANDRVGDDQANASQPTMSRLETAVDSLDVVELNRQLLEEYITNQDEDPDEITIEIDSTSAATHGDQQRALFDGHRGQNQYHPLMIADGQTGELLSVRLREGTAHDKHGAYGHLKRVLNRLTESFPETTLRFRADDGFTDPTLYQLLDEWDVQWTINFKANAVLKRRTDKVLEEITNEYEQSRSKTTGYVQLDGYQAGSWDRSRPVVAKVQAGPNGTNRRFVVCSAQPDEPKDAFEFYEGRGVCEQYIKEFKRGFRGDKMSCHQFVANAFRLVVAGIAYTAVARFRNRHLEETDLEGSWIQTIREKLFKLGARIETTTRRFWIHASSDWPNQPLFRTVAQSVMTPG